MRISKFISTFAFASVLAFGATAANANTLILSPADAPYQQTVNGPCVIGDPSCKQGTFGSYTLVPNGNNPFDVTSPGYTVAHLNSFFGNEFMVGLDVNAGGQAQLLSFFGMYVNGTLIDSFSNPNGQPVPPTFNAGNGYADYLFTNFSSLALFQATDVVTFRAAMKAESGGGEQFFILDILDTPTEEPEDPEQPLPEPAAMALLGLAMFGSAVYSRRRRQ